MKPNNIRQQSMKASASGNSTRNFGVICDNLNFREHIFLNKFVESVIIMFVIYSMSVGICLFLLQKQLQLH